MSKLLDYTGLGKFLDKLKTLFVTDVGVNGNSLTCTKDGVTSNITVPYANVGGGVLFGTVDVNSPNVAMTATVPGLTELKDGVVVYIANNVIAASSELWTLNVNNLGAKPVHNSKTLTKIASSDFAKDKAFLLIYNSTLVSGGCWIFYIGDYSDSDSTAYIMRTTEEYFVTKETLYPRVLCFTYSDTEILPSARERSTTDNKELTTLDFNPFGRIYYYSTIFVINLGDSINGVYLYYQQNIDLRYAFNTGSTLIDAKAVYLKCQPLTNNEGKRTGRVKFAEGQPIVQALPNTEDDFVYIFLGTATSEKNIQFVLYHPIYEFKNGAIRLWTNSEDFSNKADKDTQATLGNIAVFNSNGNPVDGGKSIALTLAVFFGTIDSTSTATELTATVSGLTEIVPGTTVYIYNGVISGSSSGTLNINNLGALPIYRGGNESSRVGFSKNHTWQLIYNPVRVTGGCWDMLYGLYSYVNLGYYDRESDYSPIAKEGANRSCIAFTYSETEILPICNNYVFTTLDFDPFGQIYHLSANNTIAGGSVLGSNLYPRNVIDLKNIIQSPANYLTLNKKVYLQCEPLVDGNGNRTGRVRISTATACPLVQELPTTADGYVYIYLGALGAQYYQFRLQAVHPVYEFKDGAIRLWTNEQDSAFTTSPVAGITSANITSWNNKENTSNKVTSLSSSSTNTLYPSAKLLYDLLALKLDDDVIVACQATDYGNGVVYEVNKTFSLITLNIRSGKRIWFYIGDTATPEEYTVLYRLLPLVYADYSKVEFSNNSGTFKINSSNTVTFTEATYESTTNKVTSLSSSSTNTQYPSAKLVYDTTKLLAPKDSPTLTGTPTAPTAAAGTNTTQIATTAFVNNALPTSLSDLTDDATHRLVTDTEKSNWDSKGTYSKPSGGIPKTDLASDVLSSLSKADTALLSHQDISGKENISNKVTSLSSSSTDTLYPSAKCVYDLIKDNCVFIEGNDTYPDF